MRLLYFWQYKPNWHTPQYNNGYNFSDKCRFEIVISGNSEEIELKAIKHISKNIIPDDFFYINGKKSNISQVNAIVGKNGSGKSTLLHRIAYASLKPYENNGSGETCIEVIDFGDSIKIYYCDYPIIGNQPQKNTRLFLNEASRHCLSELFGYDPKNIITINTNSNDNKDPNIKDFTIYLISNNEDYIGILRQTKIENEYYKDYKSNANDKQYYECAEQITNQAIDSWGENYYMNLCKKEHYNSFLIDTFLDPVYKQCVLKKEIFNWLYLDFIFRYLISKNIDIKNSELFSFYSAGKTLFLLIGIRNFYRFIHDDSELKKYIQHLTNIEKTQVQQISLLDSSSEEKKLGWLKIYKKEILEGGFNKILEICKKTGYDKYKDIQQLYFEIIFNELQEKYINFIEPNRQINFILDILRFNLLCEFCVHYNVILKITKNSHDLETAIDYIYSNIDDLIDNSKIHYYTNISDNFKDNDKNYYLKAKKDLAAFTEFLTDYPKYADYIYISAYNSSNGLLDFPILPLDKIFVEFFIKAFKEKMFYIKYFSISKHNYSSGERRLLDFFTSINAKLNSLINSKIRPKKNILLLIDDFDRDCHPEWQLKLLNETLKGFNKLFSEYNFHIIFSTHSPLMLTDMPKSFILCLESINNMINIDNRTINDPIIAEVIDIESETFGANVYDLYKNSFFLDNVFTGDFAKEKIDNAIKIIRTLHKKKQNNAEITFNDNKSLLSAIHILNLIGEPILRNMLNETILQIQKEDT